MGQENLRVGEIQANTRIALGQENRKVAEAYLTAMRTRNIQALGHTLHPNLQVIGPTDEVHNRSSFLATMQRVVPHLERVDVAARLASGNQSFYMYNLVFASPAAPLRTAHLMTHHDDGQIRKIEFVAGKADFHTYLKSLSQ
ncbi:MAG TPA: nuclear transport factor 2 family protein [bacterium]|nr:nuclear transport factor 2 family protein [bacterium]